MNQEKKQIMMFVIENCHDGPHVYISDLHAKYLAWRTHNHMEDTELSVDSFGRLLPKNLKRKLLKTGDRYARVVTGVSLD